jgi:hypothetical protein
MARPMTSSIQEVDTAMSRSDSAIGNPAAQRFDHAQRLRLVRRRSAISVMDGYPCGMA